MLIACFHFQGKKKEKKKSSGELRGRGQFFPRGSNISPRQHKKNVGILYHPVPAHFYAWLPR